MNKLILFCSQFAFPLQKINNAVFNEYIFYLLNNLNSIIYVVK